MQILNKLCSIIIRTKNEERWITPCLKAIFNQSYKLFEVIIVDNNSTDLTLTKAKKFDVKKIVNIDNYLPGKALNEGIRKASGKYIVCISAHCIPVNENWLQNLVNSLEQDDLIAGAYGRQEPMHFSTQSDKRDLLIVFGLDPKIQIKDSFFHNANSIIKRDVLEKFPFDSETTNIEDRLWGQTMIENNFRLAYCPEASVYHYHGIHQDGNEERLKNVVRIIENMTNLSKGGKINPLDLNICAIIPLKGESLKLGSKTLLEHTVEAAMKSKFIDKVILSTDNKENIKLVEPLGVDCPFLRPSNLSEDWVSLETVQQFTLEQLEKLNFHPDLLVHMEVTFPFREKDLFDQMITYTLENGFDSVIASHRESGFIWQEQEDGTYKRIDSGDIPRKLKEKSFIGQHGLGCVTYPSSIREGSLLGKKIGIYKVENPISFIEIRDDKTKIIAEKLFNNS